MIGGTTYTINFLFRYLASVGEVEIQIASPSHSGEGFMTGRLHIGTSIPLAFSSATSRERLLSTGWTDTTNFADKQLLRISTDECSDDAANDNDNQRPPPTVANVIPDQEAIGGMAFNYVVPANTFSDGDSDTLTYMATKARRVARARLDRQLSFDGGHEHLLDR